MPYIGNQPTTGAFPFDQFSGNGTTTSFTLTYAPAGPTSIIVTIAGVVQNPNLYSVSGTTLTFSPAPPIGTNNIAVLYLGLPVIGVSSPGNTAFFSATDITATAGQVTFTPSGAYTPGFVTVFRNGARLGNADYTATNGVTITLANPCVAGDIVTIETFILSSLVNALPLTGGTVTGSTAFNSTVNVNGANVSGFTGFKNRIINPGMVIDQRNNGASVTPTDGQYLVDRFQIYRSTATLSAQRSTIAPTGFINSLQITATSAGTRNATDYYVLQQLIEGLNIADMALGTPSASTFTLSFWVRSSVTGLYSGCINSSDNARSFVFNYTIGAANTFEYKTITIPGDTTGGWSTSNTIGMYVRFDLGSGANYQGTAGAGWQALTNRTGASGTVGWAQTSGATFYITGVQLERGSNATSFEFRSIGQELALCQRYFWGVSGVTTETQIGLFTQQSNNLAYFTVQHPVPMRAAPSVSLTGNFTWTQTGGQTTTTPSSVLTNTLNFMAQVTNTGALTIGTTGRVFLNSGATGVLAVSAEL